MGESNTVVSAYTLYRHLQQYCSHPSIYVQMSYTMKGDLMHLQKVSTKVSLRNPRRLTAGPEPSARNGQLSAYRTSKDYNNT